MPQIRFHIEGQPPSEWIEETILNRQQGTPTAVIAMGELRGKFPSAAIRIERRGDVRIPNPVKSFRYKIHLANNELRYSKLFQEPEREALLADIRDKFPSATVVEEVF